MGGEDDMGQRAVPAGLSLIEARPGLRAQQCFVGRRRDRRYQSPQPAGAGLQPFAFQCADHARNIGQREGAFLDLAGNLQA